ncbi:MAG: hypothetical protein IKC09_10010 [Oscillospiraceae bacterium]|nr:hypothetical protein [Oscillospiraceae bacterium]
MYCMQSRWRLEGNSLVYYGLRNRDRMFRNEIRLNKNQRELLSQLPRELSKQELSCLKGILGTAVVPAEQVRPVPVSLEEARFCRCCCANDYMIPGLEFDETGLCPICQTEADTRHLKSLVPLVRELPRSTGSRFDVALFYTGGKDSTFLLYHLSQVLGLRVLALTWEIPFMSASARASMENARRKFPNVEFISRWVSENQLRRVYRKLYALSENTCACPSLAYVLFYPELVANRVPYFVAGNEPAQILGLYYNHMAPQFAYTFPDNLPLNLLVNLGRILTLHPPLKPGQFHTLATMKKLAGQGGGLQDLAGYRNELVDHIVTAIHEVPELVEPLRRAIRQSSRSGHIPAFVHLDLDEICGGKYDWREVKSLLVRECGWVPPESMDKSLHTSCQIERCKEHSQFVRFYHCRSRMIPFSALEMAIASRGRNLSREDAIREIRDSLGFSLTEVPECALMRRFLED